MSNNTITVIGNLTKDPELRFIPSGDAVVNFTVVDQPRKFNRETNQWEDAGLPLFQRCTAWRQLAENIAASLSKGSAVIVTGRLVARPTHESNGVKYENLELEVAEIGPSLRYASVVITKNSPQGGGSNSSAPAQQAQRPTTSVPAAQAPSSDEPPF